MDFPNRVIPLYTSELEAMQDTAYLIKEGIVFLANVIHLQAAVIVAVIVLVSWIFRRRSTT